MAEMITPTSRPGETIYTTNCTRNTSHGTGIYLSLYRFLGPYKLPVLEILKVFQVFQSCCSHCSEMAM